jgi:CheY-like chemotaxis protein
VDFHNLTRLKRSCLRFHETLLVFSQALKTIFAILTNTLLRTAMNQKDATVFYVDDNAKAQRLLGSLMTACGFRVITASNPLALARFAALRFDLALLDYRMPFLSGSQLAKEIKSLAPNVPIVLISGYSALADSELLFIDAHFGRDTILDDLLETMWCLVRSNRMSARDRQEARLWSNAT